MQIDVVAHIRRCGYCNMLFGSKEEFESICPECMRIIKQNDYRKIVITEKVTSNLKHYIEKIYLE